MSNVPVLLIAALNRAGYIGLNGGLIYILSEDMRRFKEKTMGNVVVMGRKTFDSLPAPLEGRMTYVVSSTKTGVIFDKEGKIAGMYRDSVESAMEAAKLYADVPGKKPKSVWVAGGQEIYQQAMPYAQEIHLTYIEDDAAGDTKFPTEMMKTLGFEEDENLEFVGMMNGYEVEISRFVRNRKASNDPSLLWEILGTRQEQYSSSMIGQGAHRVRLGSIESLWCRKGVRSLVVKTATHDYNFLFESEKERDEAADQLQEIIAETGTR